VLEYLRQGLVQSLGFHIVSGAFLLALTFFGGPSPVAFVRAAPAARPSGR
jgi:hypothetical protein